MCWSRFLAQIRQKLPDIKMKRNVFCLFVSFCLGLSAPSANNPFQSETPKLTLNQLGSTSLATQPTSLPYSASLPLPMSHQPASLPSSLTHPTQPRLDLPGPLPEPLLPLSSVSNDGSQAVLNNQNPFLWGPMQLGKFLDKKGNAIRLWLSKYNLKCRIAATRTCMKTLFLVILYCGIISEPLGWFWFCSSLQASLLFLLAKTQLQGNKMSHLCIRNYQHHIFEAIAY